MSIYTSIKYAKYYSTILLKNWFVNKSSYAQHGEDSLIESIVGDDKITSFIDIGANDGVLFSNTFKFAKNGSYGLCIEPSCLPFKKLRLNHLIHPKVKCLNYAISDYKGNLYLQENGYENVLSRVSKTKIEGLSMVKSCSLLSTIRKYSKFSMVDLISLDVEGHELEVLKSWGPTPLNAKIIIVEIDKLNVDDLLTMSCLSQHTPGYSNGINLILLKEDLKFNSSPSLPPGFQKC